MGKIREKNADRINANPLREEVVAVTRVTKVVTGGRAMSFSACVIVGDGEGTIGYGHRNAKEVSDARSKATQAAKRSLEKISLYNSTILFDVEGNSGAAKVILRRAKPGTGVIAGGVMRAIFGCLGIQDIVAKSMGSSNVYSMIAATFDALRKLSSQKSIANRRGMNTDEILMSSNKKKLSN